MNSTFIIFSIILVVCISGNLAYHVPSHSVDYAKGAEIYQSQLEQKSQQHGFSQSGPELHSQQHAFSQPGHDLQSQQHGFSQSGLELQSQQHGFSQSGLELQSQQHGLSQPGQDLQSLQHGFSQSGLELQSQQHAFSQTGHDLQSQQHGFSQSGLELQSQQHGLSQPGQDLQSQQHGFSQSQGWLQQDNSIEGHQGIRDEGEKHAKVLSHTHESNGHGYQYSYETENGIKAIEHGTIHGKNLSVQGEYSYKGDDGQTYTVTYTADENGFRPQGAHIPTPPPIPEAVLKSLEQNTQVEAGGVYDDGSYKEVENQVQTHPQYQTYMQYQPEYQPQEHYDVSQYQLQQPRYHNQGLEQQGYQHLDNNHGGY